MWGKKVYEGLLLSTATTIAAILYHECYRRKLFGAYLFHRLLY